DPRGPVERGHHALRQPAVREGGPQLGALAFGRPRAARPRGRAGGRSVARPRRRAADDLRRRRDIRTVGAHRPHPTEDAGRSHPFPRRAHMKKNLMKEKLAAGQPAFGVSVMIPSPQIVEMIAAVGFDWVLLDCEHGTLTLESVELMAM